MTAPASSAPRSPIQALPVQFMTANPLSAPISIMPSTPRLRMPERSANVSPRAAYRMAVPAGTAAASTEVRKATVQMLSIAHRYGNGSMPHPSNPVTSQHLTAEQKEQNDALEHRRDGRGKPHRGLQLI